MKEEMKMEGQIRVLEEKQKKLIRDIERSADDLLVIRRALE